MIGAPAFDNQQCGALCPILAVARALCDSLRLANYPRRSSEEKFQLHENIRPSSRLFRRCFPSRALSNLKVIRSIRRLFRPTSASQKSARRLASSCAAPFQCCQVIAPSNGGPPVSPIRNRVAGESSNVDRFRPLTPQLRMCLVARLNRQRPPTSRGKTIVPMKMVLEFIGSCKTKCQRSLNWGRTPLVSLIKLHRPERATSWLLLIRLENLLQPRKPVSPIDLTDRGCLCSVGYELVRYRC